MDKKETRKRKLKEWLISLGVTLVLLAVVVGVQFWMTGTLHKSFDPEAMWRGNLIGDTVGGIILLLIINHFVKKPKEDK